MGRLELLYDHYKETCEIVRSWEKNRNSLFIRVWIFMGILFLFSIDKDSLMGILQAWSKSTYDCDIMFSSSIIQVVLWIILLIYTLRYYGININIDKKYDYIHKLEDQINTIEMDSITREGKSYLNNYPCLNNITYYSYRVIIPIIYSICIGIKLYLEFKSQDVLTVMIFQGTIGGLCFCVNIVFLVESIVDMGSSLWKWAIRLGVTIYILITIVDHFIVSIPNNIYILSMLIDVIFMGIIYRNEVLKNRVIASSNNSEVDN
ncbi:MAG: hypothetical protein E7231_06625 [Cellulosilyticum sp.]|nr:hypothetical protein [Cellulosilyticum sp.]